MTAQASARRDIDTGTNHLLAHVENGVATLTFNRPEARNALGDELSPALRSQLAALAVDDDVRVLVVTGAGPAFCAGGDVKSMGSALGADRMGAGAVEAAIAKLRDAQDTMGLRLYKFPKPTIAVLPGPAAGAGMGLALACDMRIGSPDACLVPAFGTIGLSGDYGGSWLLTRLIGTGRAREIYFTGRRLGAEEGLSLGVFNRIVPGEQLAQAAAEMAAAIASGPPIAQRYMKENLNRAENADIETAMHWEADRMIRGFATQDHKRAVAAFIAKEKPVFTGE